MAANPDTFAEIVFTLDDRELRAHPDETILQAARRHGTDIPHLCYTDGLRIDGNCRACMVEIEGERTLQPACYRHPSEGMQVRTASERARKAQSLVLELLGSDMPEASYNPASELDHWRRELELGEPRFARRAEPEADLSHPGIAVRLDACIQCTRCLRACREVQNNDVIGYAHRGAASAIVFDLADPMGESSCVGCGECVQACPTGALMPAHDVGLEVPERDVETVCPYCGVGCLVTAHVKDNRILWVDGRDGPSNHNRLCVKGRYGFDYVHNPSRLSKPLIRREGVPRPEPDDVLEATPERLAATFREASWEEALEVAAAGLRRIHDEHGPSALAGFGSAKGTNEEAYLFQKLVRTGFGTNNVDHCTRLCHASSVAALQEMVGSGGVSNQVAEVSGADLIFIIGANASENHPVAATYIKNAARAGATLIVADPRRTLLTQHADHVLQFNPDTDVALLNALLHVIVEEGLVDEDFVAKRTSGFEELKAHVADYSPERVAPICGIPAERLREIARLYGSAPNAMIFWGMGVAQSVHGTDNARALISLALITGHVGRPSNGLHPLRGQNNVQGASDVGLIPMVLPDYTPVGNDEARARFEQAWGTALDPDPGLTVVEIMHQANAGHIRGMYVMGENPAMSDPNLHHARAGLQRLEHLVVQEIFPTETALYADVVLPASALYEKSGTVTNTDRRVQLVRPALTPPGEARQDLWIIQELARRLGLDWQYDGPRDVFAELRTVMDSIAGITWERLEATDSVTYPCHNEGDPGEGVVFRERFPTADGRARLSPAAYAHGPELPDDEFPLVLITGRQLEHWHTGAMTRRASVLDAIEPMPTISLHRDSLVRFGLQAGDAITVESHHGTVTAYARADDALMPGQLFLPFAYREAAANLLTGDALDPFGKIPGFKFTAAAVRVRAAEPAEAARLSTQSPL